MWNYYMSQLRLDWSWNVVKCRGWWQRFEIFLSQPHWFRENSVPPPRVSFTQSDSASFHPSVPLSQFPWLHSQFTLFIIFPLIFPSLHLPPLHPYSFILINLFNRFQKRLCLSSYLSVSSRVLPCVCPPACCGRLCTRWLVCSASPSAQQPPLLFNVTGPVLVPLSTVGSFSSVWRFPLCSRFLLWKENNRKPEETTGR